METTPTPHFAGSYPTPQVGEPSWSIALLFPAQGSWTEDDYLSLNTNWLVEYSDGCVHVLPMPTLFHQRIVRFPHAVIQAHVLHHGLGEVLFAPLPVRLQPGKYREPDIIYLRSDRVRADRYPDGADLAVELVSEGEEVRHRDLVIKRSDYARAGISEYWIVDPREKQILVLSLEGQAYRLHGDFGIGELATSALLPGLSVTVADVFAAGAT